MKLSAVIRRSLWFYRRTHAGVIGAAAVATAVLTGALLVGDSVTGTLREMAHLRLGDTTLAMASGDRVFRAELGPQLAEKLNTAVAPVLQVSATATIPGDDSAPRARGVTVLGVTEAFWKLWPGRDAKPPADGEVLLDRRLAKRLGVDKGKEVILVMEKPSAFPRDAPLSTVSEASITPGVTVAGLLDDDQFARFSLRANQTAPLNVFVPLDWLAKKLELAGKANLLLVGKSPDGSVTADRANEAMSQVWKLADAGLELRNNELRTNRIFLDPAVVRAVQTTFAPEEHDHDDTLPADPFPYKQPEEPEGILTYFVNELRVADRSVPYSTVTARGRLGCDHQSLKDGEAIINQWLADHLSAKPGDTMTMKYYVLGPMRRLVEWSSEFRIARIIPNDHHLLDRRLMPDFPGLSATMTNCKEWSPGIPIDQNKIGDDDRKYWKDYRGTPKAIISLAAGQRLWANRFGNLTAIRLPGSLPEAKTYESQIRKALSPGSVGMVFRDVAGQAHAAASQALDFGLLFLGLSMFLVAAAVLLTAMVFALGVRQRTGELGLLLAIGFTPGRVRRLVLAEALVLAVAGVAIGLPLGVAYTHVVLGGLASVWSGAVASAAIGFHASWTTIAIGATASLVVAMLAILAVLRKQFRREVRCLLDDIGPEASPTRARPLLHDPSVVTFLTCLVIAAASLVAIPSMVGAFFAAGFALLVGLLAACRTWLGRIGLRRSTGQLSLSRIGVRAAGRRPGRSLGVAAIVACGVFMVVAVGANRVSPLDDAWRRTSGTGGFALFAESSLAVFGDLNTSAGRKPFAMDKTPWEGVTVAHARLKDGDEASCLNLNRAQLPRLIGIDPEELAGRFTFIETLKPVDAPGSPWELLNENFGASVVPAIGDEATVRWALGKSVGESLEFVDERGVKFKVKIVAKIANSIFQGSLLISEKRFIQRYVRSAGHRVFLIDAPPERAKSLAGELNRKMGDVGATAARTVERLAEFNTIQSTYIAMFQALGSLGLVLGTVGLALVVVRNVMERRGELAVMWAVGFHRPATGKMLLAEHAGLLVAGVFSGLCAALVAAGPAIRSAGTQLPYGSLAATVLGVLAFGLLWIILASLPAMWGKRLSALRNE